MDFVLSGLAACGACVFTHPLEVVKTRMQLQGELQRRGSYPVHYRSVLQAARAVWRADGPRALQRGLAAGLLYQFGMNGVRLGAYAAADTAGYTRNAATGRVSGCKSTAAGALAGVAGALLASPFYLVKTHLQTQSTSAIAVGHQYKHQGMLDALVTIYQRHGIVGLWRGSGAAVPRVMVGSAAQLSTFSEAKQFTEDLQVFKPHSWLVSLTAGLVSSVFVVLAMTPFDVISTRLYNQPVDKKGKGIFYAGYLDCFAKTMQKESFLGLYKGTGASYFRLGPHTILSLLFWEELRKFYWQ
uniref:solute carrier family 25 member 35 n=1 Tax=Pristiophorus japonicus TaxID=55135 RepID=UPI00398F639D